MKLKRMAAVLLALLAALSIVPSPALAAGTKSETVYALLDHYGNVGAIYVVNRLIGEYTDFGRYTEIINLSTPSAPVVEGDKITFPDKNVEGGLYYQGTAKGELPFVFFVKYYLDGKRIEADKLGGAAGHLKIQIRGDVNTACDERVRDGYMAQISLSLKQSVADNISAPGGSTVIAGNAANINYTILPGKSGEFTLEADVRDFKMDGIVITLLKGTISGFGDAIDETKKGFDDMAGGADEIAEGTEDLKDGIKSLLGGLYKLKSGLSSIVSSGADIAKGMGEFSAGLKDYTDGVGGLASASENIKQGLEALSSNADGVAGGVAQIDGALKSISSNADLRNLAESLSSSGDPSVRALAQGTLQTLNSLGGLSGGLGQASAAVNEFASGVKQIASQYGDFDAGLRSSADGGGQLIEGFRGIADGFASYLSGIKKCSNGMGSLYSSVKGLPDDVQQLIDGQLKFKDGILDAKKEITQRMENFVPDDSPAVSFASPDKNHPESVQYILKTPEIAVPKQAAADTAEEKEEDFFTRLVNLFR